MGLSRFWQRAQRQASKNAQERFVSAWRLYLASVIQQAERRDKSYICTVEEYMISRRYNIGFDPSVAMMEICLELDIPHSVMQHPAFVTLLNTAINMIILENVCRSHLFE